MPVSQPSRAVVAISLIGAVALSWLIFTKSSAKKPTDDKELVRILLAENLSTRTFHFANVVHASSGKRVIPLSDDPRHQRMLAAIEKALADTIHELNEDDSPVRKLRRINEASRYFEDGLLARLDAVSGVTCSIPQTRAGTSQRAGYPDLRVFNEEDGTVFYLDPKLMEQGSEASTLRTFYFEPKNETLKITEDAVHLLCGIVHDGKAGAWTFNSWRLVDLSSLRVRLKAEFQASNAEIYPAKSEN